MDYAWCLRRTIPQTRVRPSPIRNCRNALFAEAWNLHFGFRDFKPSRDFWSLELLLVETILKETQLQQCARSCGHELVRKAMDSVKSGDEGHSPTNQDECFTRFSKAARCGQSSSLMAVNFRPTPRPEATWRTTASALIAPS